MVQDPGAWPGAESGPKETVSHRELQGKNHPAHPLAPGGAQKTEDPVTLTIGSTLHREEGGGGLGARGGHGAPPAPILHHRD